MDRFNIYLVGVGGQGIGLLSEIVTRAIDHSGQRVIGADTHGLAQRGGMVSSHIRMGEKVHSALIGQNSADLCLSLERNEALRAMNDYLKDGSTLIYYDAVWQPLDVRLGKEKETSNTLIAQEAKRRKITVLKIFDADLSDSRMQNIVIAAEIAKQGLIPGVNRPHFIEAMNDLMQGRMLSANLALFNEKVV